MTAATKATLEARIAELETQLAASPDALPNDQIRLVGLLKGVKSISRPEAKLSVSAFLVNTSRELRGDQKLTVDLPIDSLIATDNGQPLASQLLDLAAHSVWARVAVTGFWTVFGDIITNQRGYPVAQRRQLRITAIEVLSHQPIDADCAPQLPAPYATEPTSDEIPF
jgi:hypothetical protein